MSEIFDIASQFMQNKRNQHGTLALALLMASAIFGTFGGITGTAGWLALALMSLPFLYSAFPKTWT